MNRLASSFAAAFLSVSTVAGSVAATDNPTGVPASSDYQLELKASDLEVIASEVLRRQPLLSASPGIKAAHGYRGAGGESASVIFYPHLESQGIKQAFQVSCRRDDPVSAWSCPIIEIRRYVKLDFQDFEVRVMSSVDLNVVMAITEATRPVAASAVPDASTVDTVLVIHPANDGYLVLWGSRPGYAGVLVETRLRSSGDPADPGDWESAVLPPDLE